jgi:hypothetical protein
MNRSDRIGSCTMDNLGTSDRRDRLSCRGRRHRGQASATPVGPNMRVCAGCREQLEEDLLELPGWYDLCAHALDLGGPRPAERVRGSRPRGIDLREAVVTVRTEILGALASWCGLVAGERGVSAPDELSVRRLVSFLAIHLNWLVAHPAAADLVDGMDVLVTSARQVVRPDEGMRVELGPCSRPGCDEPVVAESGTENQVTYRVACAAEHEVRPQEWLLLRDRGGNLGATPTEAE